MCDALILCSKQVMHKCPVACGGKQHLVADQTGTCLALQHEWVGQVQGLSCEIELWAAVLF